ncbi:hypothetical protein ACQ4N7_02490 [Nodosilinea sp. AN01ver1]|uniref:hypothetical protein n=1 Tax=Nodosilinea sp. AN01ver1 TaxID=3423362 RepID=UPI003D323EFB
MAKRVAPKRLSLALLVALASVLLPATAQANPDRITCQATTPLNQGGSLTYRLTGTVPAVTDGSVPQNPIGTGLSLTVQQRDGAGRVQTLISAAALSDYEHIAPDADYSQLPFGDRFRGQPNRGHRLYSATASVNGLYVSLRPTSGQPQQVQVVHYLSRGQYVRSEVGSCQAG